METLEEAVEAYPQFSVVKDFLKMGIMSMEWSHCHVIQPSLLASLWAGVPATKKAAAAYNKS